MKYRILGKTGFKVSEVSFGAWAIGGAWGDVSDSESMAALHKAVDLGVNFIDTADGYGDGRSERLIGKLKKERSEEIIVATKAGRRLDPHVADGYNEKNITAFVEESLKNLQVEALDLLQLHCPPTEVYYRPEVFAALDNLVQQGKLRNYGVSVEKVEEAMKAIEYPNVATVQIIFNMFRQRPIERFLPLCKEKNIGVLARVPLASGLLTGKMSKDTQFASDDHRNFNRDGAAFDKGETFAGVPFEQGLLAVEKLKTIVPDGYTLAQLALRWILMFPEVSCCIPGAKRPSQAEANVAATNMPELSQDVMNQIEQIYTEYIKPEVHHRW